MSDNYLINHLYANEYVHIVFYWFWDCVLNLPFLHLERFLKNKSVALSFGDLVEHDFDLLCSMKLWQNVLFQGFKFKLQNRIIQNWLLAQLTFKCLWRTFWKKKIIRSPCVCRFKNVYLGWALQSWFDSASSEKYPTIIAPWISASWHHECCRSFFRCSGSDTLFPSCGGTKCIFVYEFWENHT